MSTEARTMREVLGPTPGCPACSLSGIWGHGRKHTAACRLRRTEWEATYTGQDVREEMDRERKQIKREIVTPSRIAVASAFENTMASASASSVPVEDAEMEERGEKRAGGDIERLLEESMEVDACDVFEVHLTEREACLNEQALHGRRGMRPHGCIHIGYPSRG
eukprot:6466707-Amphidinium_carterae.1